MRAAQQRRLTPLLIGACALVLLALAALALGAGRHVHWDAPADAANLPSARESAKVPAAPPLQHYADIWQRPLFNTDRRPAPTAFGDDKSDASLGDFDLTGIVITPTLRMVLLHNRKTDADVRVREGEGFAGNRWTLQSVKPRSATFTGDGGRTLLPLKVAGQSDADATASAIRGAHADNGHSAMAPPRTPTRTQPAKVGLPSMTLQSSSSLTPPTAAQIKAGNAQKARVKALLKKRIEDQRRRQSPAAHDGDH